MAEANLKKIVKAGVDAALDFEYEGQTIREWVKELKAYKEQEPCEDAISRQWVLDVVNNFVFDTETDRNRIIHIIRDTAPSVTPNQKWVPVSESLPRDFQRVQITVVNYAGDKVVRAAIYISPRRQFRVEGSSDFWEVGEKGLLAWMPLPEPYEPKEREEKR